MVNLCLNACIELHSLGMKKDVDPSSLKESYNIVKNANGKWFKSTKPSLHEAAVLTTLDLDNMPALKQLADSLDEIDQEIKKDGGRIFISEYLVYKIKKGSQTPLIMYENTSKEDGKYRKLCDEILSQGISRDRYRTEETYMLTKSAGNEWSITSSHENHSAQKAILELTKMPLLKNLTQKISRNDPQFSINGGRVFITPTRVYRLKNKIEFVI